MNQELFNKHIYHIVRYSHIDVITTIFIDGQRYDFNRNHRAISISNEWSTIYYENILTCQGEIMIGNCQTTDLQVLSMYFQALSDYAKLTGV